MPRIVFTPQLQRHVPAPPADVPVAATLREALDAAFASNPRLRGYVLDEQGHLRKHVVVYVDGARVRDRERLSETLRPESEIHVLQALTGG